MNQQIAYLVGGIFFCIQAILHAAGVQVILQKRYRGLPAARKFQKRQAVLEAAFGLIALAYFFLKPQGAMELILGVLLVIDAVFMILNSRTFNKSIQK